MTLPNNNFDEIGLESASFWWPNFFIIKSTYILKKWCVVCLFVCTRQDATLA